jgi:hypothetical protein
MKPKQTILRINLPHGVRLFPSQFRELLAKIPQLKNGLFHRDEAGQTLNERPGVRVAGGRGWVGLVSDEKNELLVREAAGAAIMAVSEFTGRACPVQIEKTDFWLKALHEPKIYWVREMVLKRGAKARAQNLANLIEDRMLAAIEDACERYSIDCPTADSLGIKTIEIVHECGLRLQTTSGVTNQFVQLVDARVMIHADLEGEWFVGNLTSRGYGRIILPRPGLQFDAPRKAGFLQ